MIFGTCLNKSMSEKNHKLSHHNAMRQPLDNLFYYLHTLSPSSPTAYWRLNSILSVCNPDWGSCRKRKDLLSVCANCVPVSNAVVAQGFRLLHRKEAGMREV